MNIQKTKASQYYRAGFIVLCDYLQASLRINIAKCEDPKEMGLLEKLAVDAHSLVTRDGTLEMRYEGSLSDQRKEVTVLLREVMDQAVSRTVFLGASTENVSLEQIPVEGLKRVSEKILNKVETFINDNLGLSFVEFSHGSSFYRLILTGKTSYDLMIFSKKLNSWSVRTAFKTV